jgi:hypothetical protein
MEVMGKHNAVKSTIQTGRALRLMLRAISDNMFDVMVHFVTIAILVREVLKIS